jgi:hypothetical protein
LVCAAALFAFGATAATASRDFAAGSAKTEMGLTIANMGEHASFQVHCLKGQNCTSFPNCDASGQMVYKADASPFAAGGPLAFQARIEQLQIRFLPSLPGAHFAAFYGIITDVDEGPQSLVGFEFLVDLFDSGLAGGSGDEFLLETPREASPFGGTCSPPIAGKVIDQGNIVIKTTP